MIEADCALFFSTPTKRRTAESYATPRRPYRRIGRLRCGASRGQAALTPPREKERTPGPAGRCDGCHEMALYCQEVRTARFASCPVTGPSPATGWVRPGRIALAMDQRTGTRVGVSLLLYLPIGATRAACFRNAIGRGRHDKVSGFMAKWTHKKAFAEFGVTPRNVQWSWSGRNEETKTVVLTVWQDGWKRDDSGKLVYQRRHDGGGTTKPGFKSFVDDMQWAIAHCDGLFSVIIAKAVDPKAVPRQIEECWPKPGMRMKIRDFDPETGFLTAETI